jgi:chromosome segregation ATPase
MSTELDRAAIRDCLEICKDLIQTETDEMEAMYEAKLAVKQEAIGHLMRCFEKVSRKNANLTKKLHRTQMDNYRLYGSVLKSTKNTASLKRTTKLLAKSEGKVRQISGLCLTITDKDEEIAQLQQEMRETDICNNQLEGELRGARASIATLQDDADALEQELADTRRSLGASENAVGSLSAQIAQLKGQNEENLERAHKEVREAHQHNQMLFRIIESNETGLNALRERQAEFEHKVHTTSCMFVARIDAVEALAVGVCQVAQSLFDAVHARSARCDKDVAEWEARCNELVVEIEALKQQPKSPAPAPKPPAKAPTNASNKRSEKELEDLRLRLAEQESDFKRVKATSEVVRTALTANRDRLKSTVAEMEWLKKQQLLLVKSNDVYVAHFLNAASVAFPDLHALCQKLAEDNAVRRRVQQIMSVRTTRAVGDWLSRILHFVEMIEREQPALLEPQEHHFKSTLEMDPDGR